MIRQKAPNQQLTTINISGIGEIKEGFDGTNGWELNPMTGPALKKGVALEQAARSAGDLRSTPTGRLMAGLGKDGSEEEKEEQLQQLEDDGEAQQQQQLVASKSEVLQDDRASFLLQLDQHILNSRKRAKEGKWPEPAPLITPMLDYKVSQSILVELLEMRQNLERGTAL